MGKGLVRTFCSPASELWLCRLQLLPQQRCKDHPVKQENLTNYIFLLGKVLVPYPIAMRSYSHSFCIKQPLLLLDIIIVCLQQVT